MTAARVNLVVDQGADFLAQFFWMDQSDTPIRVEPPLRMEVYTSDTRQIQMALQAGEMEEDNSYDIVYNSDNGMIQILISAERTLSLPAGTYIYDLFVGYSDNATQEIRRHRLIEGTIEVRGRVTKHV